jgi:outer membrane protein assembly factor BamD
MTSKAYLRPFFLSFLLCFGFSLILGGGCSSDEKKSDTAEGTFGIAQGYEKDERYEDAITKYTEVKNKFPYSRFSPMAELAIADIQFKREAWPEAQGAYQAFKELHPKHEKIGYVTYRLGMSYFNQLPSSVDRDLTLATSAISAFDEIIVKYPNSEFALDSKQKKEAALKMMAEKEQYIADFYFKHEKYDSALGRYETMLKKYPNLGCDPAALKGAAISALRLGDNDKAKKYFQRLQTEFANSAEAADTAGEMKR